MAKGKQKDKLTVYKIMVSYFATNNFSETARILKIPQTTVETIVKRNRNKPEFVKLCDEKKIVFADTATEIINKGLKLLNRRMDIALDREAELDELIADIYAADKGDIPPEEKNKLMSKIRTLQIQKIGEITTAIGTLYDKRALALGESTENVTFNMPDEVKKYAE